MSDRWFKVCKREELKPGQARSITILGRPYAVFDVDGSLHGLDAACKHMRANLATGKLRGKVVECFMHRWTYDVTTGKCHSNEGMDTASREVKVEDGEVWISVHWPNET
ncbi:MAG: Rieske (2Fe-2S) protein [Calditrichaeota bacterium]|nr:Rieske (2Fe-2S) protein [Calditrichota bacterium]MCB9366314.1 Rieske (2Fe-2S) protein [Calditrichota bacterium]